MCTSFSLCFCIFRTKEDFAKVILAKLSATAYNEKKQAERKRFAMNRRRGYLLLGLTALIFSTTEVALKGVGDAFSPMQLTAERVLIGGLFLLPFALSQLRRAGIRLSGRDFRLFAAMGLLTAMHLSLMQLAVVHADASAVATIYSGNPVFAIFFAHFLLHEPLRRNHLLALGFEVVGILFILNPAQLEMSATGFALTLSSSALYALYGTWSKRHVARYGSAVLTSFNLLFGGTELLALLLLCRLPAVAALCGQLGLSVFANVSLLTGFTPHTAAVLLYVGVVVAGAGNLLMVQVARDTSATESSFFYLVKPILSAIIAAAVLHETISPHRILGIAFFTAASLCVVVPLLREVRRAGAR